MKAKTLICPEDVQGTQNGKLNSYIVKTRRLNNGEYNVHADSMHKN